MTHTKVFTDSLYSVTLLSEWNAVTTFYKQLHSALEGCDLQCGKGLGEGQSYVATPKETKPGLQGARNGFKEVGLWALLDMQVVGPEQRSSRVWITVLLQWLWYSCWLTLKQHWTVSLIVILGTSCFLEVCQPSLTHADQIFTRWTTISWLLTHPTATCKATINILRLEGLLHD